MGKCKICSKPAKGKYCSPKHQKKAWKLYNREKYLTGKRKYRKEHAEEIKSYNKSWKKANPEKVINYRQNYGNQNNSVD